MWYSLRRTIMEQLRLFRPDAVVGYWTHPDGECAARIAGVPSAVMVGGSDVLLLSRNAVRRRRILDVLRAADVVVPVSEDLKTKLVSMGVVADKVHVVPRGVDTSRFLPGDRQASRRKLGIPQGLPVLLWVGRMVPVKGVDVLVDACGRMRDGGVPFHLYLVGTGELRKALAHRVERLDLSGRVTFAGPVRHGDLPDWYRSADVTVLPSRSEGIPNVLRESLACGTPFVASRVGGIPEIAQEGYSWLVPPDRPQELAAALTEALGHRDSIGAHGRKSVSSWADSADALVRALQPLVAADGQNNPG